LTRSLVIKKGLRLKRLSYCVGEQSRLSSDLVLLTKWVISPQPGQLNTYKDAVDRLNASIAFQSSENDYRQMVSACRHFWISRVSESPLIPGTFTRNGRKKADTNVHQTRRGRFIWAHPSPRGGPRRNTIPACSLVLATTARVILAQPPTPIDPSFPPCCAVHPFNAERGATRVRRYARHLEQEMPRNAGKTGH
jgi:hypothetical protein